jgi:hypothetical protein
MHVHVRVSGTEHPHSLLIENNTVHSSSLFRRVASTEPTEHPTTLSDCPECSHVLNAFKHSPTKKRPDQTRAKPTLPCQTKQDQTKRGSGPPAGSHCVMAILMRRVSSRVRPSSWSSSATRDTSSALSSCLLQATPQVHECQPPALRVNVLVVVQN